MQLVPGSSSGAENSWWNQENHRKPYRFWVKKNMGFKTLRSIEIELEAYINGGEKHKTQGNWRIALLHGSSCSNGVFRLCPSAHCPRSVILVESYSIIHSFLSCFLPSFLVEPGFKSPVLDTKHLGLSKNHKVPKQIPQNSMGGVTASRRHDPSHFMIINLRPGGPGGPKGTSVLHLGALAFVLVSRRVIDLYPSGCVTACKIM